MELARWFMIYCPMSGRELSWFSMKRLRFLSSVPVLLLISLRAITLSRRSRSLFPSYPIFTERFSKGRYSLGITKLLFYLTLGIELFWSLILFRSKSLIKRAFISSNSDCHLLCCKLKIWDHSSSFAPEMFFFKSKLRLPTSTELKSLLYTSP